MAIPSELLLLLFFPLILLLVVYRTLSSPAANSKLPPSPPKLPLIGNLHQLGSLPHRSLHALAQKLGPVMLLNLGSFPTLVVSSADAADEVLRTHDPIFANRPALELARRIFYNRRDVIFVSQGEHWRHVRRICVTHLLSVSKVQSFRPVREEELSLLLDRIRVSSPAPVNLSKLLNYFTSYTTSRIALGKKYSARGDEASDNKFCRLIEEIALLFGGFYVRDYIPSLGWWCWLSGTDARVDRLFRKWDAFLDDVIRDHEQDGGGGGGDLVDVLLALHKDDNSLSKFEVKAILLDMFSAGTDTSYIAMEWTMAELVRNPAVMKKVQDEVREAAAGKAAVDEEDVSRLVYLKAVIKEVMRLHPPAPLLVPRESLEDAQVLGYRVPAGTRVMVSPWSVGRDPKYWDDPEAFRPERFVGSDVDFRGQHLHLIPFGAGRRMCPGVQLAMSTVVLALANLVHCFNWTLPDGKRCGDLDMVEASGFTARMRSDLIVRATPRGDPLAVPSLQQK